MRRAFAIATILVLIPVIPVLASTPPKSGASCPKVKKVEVHLGKRFTCVKKGRSLVWSRGVTVKNVTPTVTPSPTASPTPKPTITTIENQDLTPCKLPVLDGRGDVAVGGFPRIGARLKSLGRVSTKVIFVDFSDAKAKLTPQQAFAKIENSVGLFTELSYGLFDFALDPTYRWYQMSKPSSAYAPLNRSFETHRAYISEATSLADPDVDFSTAEAVLIVGNPEAQGLGTSGPAFTPLQGSGITLDGRYIGNGATSAFDLNYWRYIWLNHEFGHALGLPDLYAFQPEDSSNPHDGHRFVGEYSLMGLSSLDANSPGFLAWERWLLGWLEDNQIRCVTEKSATQLLTPIGRKGGVKAVVVPLSPSKVVVIESRRPEGVDRNLAKSGALVYLVDSSIQSGFGPVRVFPADKSDPRRLQSTRAVGESVIVEGVSITVKESGSQGDLVEVKVS